LIEVAPTESLETVLYEDYGVINSSDALSYDGVVEGLAVSDTEYGPEIAFSDSLGLATIRGDLLQLIPVVVDHGSTAVEFEVFVTSATILGVEAMDLEAPVLFDTHMDLLTTVRGEMYLSSSGAVTVDVDFLGPDGEAVGPGRRLTFDGSVSGQGAGASEPASGENIEQIQYATSIADQNDIIRGCVLPCVSHMECICEGANNPSQSCTQEKCDDQSACTGGGGDCEWRNKIQGAVGPSAFAFLLFCLFIRRVEIA